MLSIIVAHIDNIIVFCYYNIQTKRCQTKKQKGKGDRLLKIVTFGEILFDVYGDKRYIGGAGLNFAAHCAKCGAQSYLISAVGKDGLGEQALKIIKGLGVFPDFIRYSSQDTGRCLAALDADGVPSYDVLRDVAYDHIELSDKSISDINSLGADALYFGTLIQRSAVSRRSLKKLCAEGSFREIVCDINLRKNCYDSDSVKFCFEQATVLKLSGEEEPLMRDFSLYRTHLSDPQSICQAICDAYAKLRYVVFTMGDKGSFVYDAKRKTGFVQEAKKVKLASTVGAGDSYLAAWMTSYLAGCDWKVCARNAAEISGYVVSQMAAIPDYTFVGGKIYEKSC